MSPKRPPRPGRTQLRVGRLVKAHGLKGAIKLELYTDDPDRRFQPGAQFALQVPTSSAWHGKKLELTELRWYNTHAVGFFKDVPDRTAAESLVKAVLWVDQDAAELPEEDDAWYDHQLVGLDVQRDGVSVGRVARVQHLPAQDLLIVTTADGEVMVPFVSAIVPEVDVTAGVVTITPPAGLFEEIADDDPEPAATRSRPAESADADARSSGPAGADDRIVADGSDPSPSVPDDASEDEAAEDESAEDESAEDESAEVEAAEDEAAEDDGPEPRP